MDEQVKARLIGATVLVTIAVLLVPELLSGPKRDVSGPSAGDGKRGTRTYTIDLGGAVASGARVQPLPPPAQRAGETPRLPTVEAPGVAAQPRDPGREAAGEEAAPAVTPAATVASNDPIAPPLRGTTPGEVTVAPPTAAVPKGSWSVQVGAFGSADSARKLVADLEKGGLPAYVAPLSRNGKTLHRVRVGPEPTRAAAEKVAEQVKGRGLPAAVVAAD